MTAEETRWLAQVMPSTEQLDELLGDDPVAALLGLASQRAPIETGFAGNPGDDPAITAQFALAQAAAYKLKKKAFPSLSDEEVTALHAFVHLVARPALRVRDGHIGGVPDLWKRTLVTDAAIVEQRILSVGRIDLHDRSHTGTGWFVAPGLLLTNKHVVAALCGFNIHVDKTWRTQLPGRVPQYNELWKTKPAMRPTWDPADAPDAAQTAPGVITKIRAIHADLDMGLLEIEGIVRDPLPLSASGPASLSGHDVYIAGYPAVLENQNVHPALAQLLFADAEATGLKRVSPGQLAGLVAPMPIAPDQPREAHDASTLGGNSGSPVIDFDNHRVVALHYSGQYGKANNSVPLWLVKDDPFFTDNNIPFRDS